MLKIVPDPPLHHHSLEDTLIQDADYAQCAQAVAHQAILMMATIHEIESLSVQLESALIQLQMQAAARPLH